MIKFNDVSYILNDRSLLINFNYDFSSGAYYINNKVVIDLISSNRVPTNGNIYFDSDVIRINDIIDSNYKCSNDLINLDILNKLRLNDIYITNLSNEERKLLNLLHILIENKYKNIIYDGKLSDYEYKIIKPYIKDKTIIFTNKIKNVKMNELYFTDGIIDYEKKNINIFKEIINSFSNKTKLILSLLLITLIAIIIPLMQYDIKYANYINIKYNDLGLVEVVKKDEGSFFNHNEKKEALSINEVKIYLKNEVLLYNKNEARNINDLIDLGLYLYPGYVNLTYDGAVVYDELAKSMYINKCFKDIDYNKTYNNDEELFKDLIGKEIDVTNTIYKEIIKFNKICGIYDSNKSNLNYEYLTQENINNIFYSYTNNKTINLDGSINDQNGKVIISNIKTMNNYINASLDANTILLYNNLLNGNYVYHFNENSQIDLKENEVIVPISFISELAGKEIDIAEIMDLLNNASDKVDLNLPNLNNVYYLNCADFNIPINVVGISTKDELIVASDIIYNYVPTTIVCNTRKIDNLANTINELAKENISFNYSKSNEVINRKDSANKVVLTIISISILAILLILIINRKNIKNNFNKGNGLKTYLTNGLINIFKESVLLTIILSFISFIFSIIINIITNINKEIFLMFVEFIPLTIIYIFITSILFTTINLICSKKRFKV